MSEEEKSPAVESAPEKSPALESLAKTAEVQEEGDKNGDEQKIESDSEKSPAVDDPVNKLTVEAPNEMAPSVNDTKTDVKEDGSSELIQEDESKVDPALVESLTEGFLSKVLPNLQTSKAMLEELMRNQQVLIETVQQENTKFNDCDSFQKLEETMKKAKIYHTKLLTLRKDMNSLHEKSARLKKRAVKLQQNKQKEELHRAHKRDKEVEREKMLVAKPAPRRQDTPAAVIDKSVIPEPSYSQS